MPAATANDTMIWNFKLLSHNTLDGFGGMGEGMSMQLAKDGRRILWLAHESAPKNFTAVDVTDPQTPKIVARADLPHNHMRSNSLETVGDMLAVAYQTQQTGTAAGRASSCSTSRRRKTRSAIAFFDCSGPDLARRAPAVVRRRRIHPHELGRGRLPADATRTTTSSTSASTCSNPSKPVEVGRWWLPGTQRGRQRRAAGAPPGASSTPASAPHNTNVYPQRPDRVYMGYIDGGMIILDIADKAHPKMVVALGLPPAQPRLHPHRRAVLRARPAGRQRRVHPQRRRRLAEAGVDRRQPHRGQTRCRSRPARCRRSRPSRAAAAASARTICGRTCRRKAAGNPTHRPRHLLQRRPAGLRPVEPVPAEGGRAISCRQAENAPTGACQINDVFVDDRGIVFCVDRHVGGLYALEMDF